MRYGLIIIKSLIFLIYVNKRYYLGLASEMICSAPPEKDVNINGDFDWWYLFSD